MNIRVKLPLNKIKMNGNDKNNWIRMDKFLSFFTLPLKLSSDNLGIDNGWTERKTCDGKVTICGGKFKGVEYLDSIQRAGNIHNPYNDYVTPLEIMDLMTPGGIIFFKDFYKDVINDLIEKRENRIKDYENKILILQEEIDNLSTYFEISLE